VGYIFDQARYWQAA